jgi:hypothetical protein
MYGTLDTRGKDKIINGIDEQRHALFNFQTTTNSDLPTTYFFTDHQHAFRSLFNTTLPQVEAF